MTAAPLSPERLAEIAKLYVDVDANGYLGWDMAREGFAAIPELLAEIAHLAAEVIHWREARRIALEAGEVLVKQREERDALIVKLEAKLKSALATIEKFRALPLS